MRRALEAYKVAFPHIEAILVGTRRDDPHGGEYIIILISSPSFAKFVISIILNHFGTYSHLIFP